MLRRYGQRLPVDTPSSIGGDGIVSQTSSLDAIATDEARITGRARVEFRRPLLWDRLAAKSLSRTTGARS